MSSIYRNILLAALAVALAACNASPGKMLSNSVPIYATYAEAQAVAGGMFGAVPVEVSSEFGLQLVSAAYGNAAVQVRSRSGRVGWVPASALPATCADRVTQKCTEPLSAQ